MVDDLAAPAAARAAHAVAAARGAAGVGGIGSRERRAAGARGDDAAAVWQDREALELVPRVGAKRVVGRSHAPII